MAGKRKNRYDEKNIFMEYNFASLPGGADNIPAEKKRAKELRNTSWWKRKLSSGECYYCGGKFKPADLTMDHKIPIARGGRSEKLNLVPACKDCNNKKKYLLPVEWEEYMTRIKNS